MQNNKNNHKSIEEEIKFLKKRFGDFLKLESERVKIEKALFESESKYRTLIEQIPAITYIAALDKQSTTLYVSPQIKTYLGYTQEDYKNDPDIWRKRLHPDDSDRVMAELISSRVGSRPFKSEYRMVTKDGRVVWFRDEARVIKDNAGNPLYLQGVMYDITERRRAEEELKAAHLELQETQNELIQSEKLSTLGVFSAGIAHEVKNPLGIILAGAEFLEKKLSVSDKDIKISIAKIKDSTIKANKVLQSLLQYARPAKLRITKINSENILKNVLSLLKYRLILAKIKVRVDFQKPGMLIAADKNQIYHALFNILNNAIEAMPKGGEIKIETYRKFMPEVSFKGRSCVIEIIDNGRGIAKKDLPKLLNPFFTTKRDGAGLGLYVTNSIIGNLGGKLIIDSALGKGTQIKIVLPSCGRLKWANKPKKS